MRITELTDQERDLFIIQCLARFKEHHRITRSTQIEIALYLVAAGICACGAVWAFTLPGPDGLALPAWLSHYLWPVVLGLTGLCLLAIGWFKFMAHEVTMRAGERVFLLLVFEKCAKQNIEFSANEIISFLKQVPDSITASEELRRARRAEKTRA